MSKTNKDSAKANVETVVAEAAVGRPEANSEGHLGASTSVSSAAPSERTAFYTSRDDALPRPKKRARGITLARHVVQVFMLCVYALPLLYLGWGLLGAYAGTGGEFAESVVPANLVFWGSLSSSQLFGINLLDPFSALQVIVASKQVATALAWALPILIVFALVRGRAFCGWVCPVNLLGEVVDFVRGKLNLRVYELPVPRVAKPLIALAVLALSAILQIPLYESINPIGALNRAILFGSTLGVLTLVAIVVAELFFGHRVWCRSLCPLGGFYQVIGLVGLLSVKIDHDACIGCDKCKHACLCDPSILNAAVAGEANRVASGDCMLCGECVDACPTKALRVAPCAPSKSVL